MKWRKVNEHSERVLVVRPQFYCHAPVGGPSHVTLLTVPGKLDPVVVLAYRCAARTSCISRVVLGVRLPESVSFRV